MMPVAASNAHLGDRLTFGFATYLVLLALLYLRPIEAFAPELIVYRPMLILMLVTFAFALMQPGAMAHLARTGQITTLLLTFAAIVPFSVLANLWLSGAISAVIDFVPSIIAFLSTIIFAATPRRLRTICRVLVVCMTVLAVAGILAYHTGFLMEKLVISQWQWSGNEDDTASIATYVVPADDPISGRLWRVRSLGLLSDPNDFAQAMIAVIPLLIVFYRKRAIVGNFLFVGLPGAILIYCIYLTHSRGALLGLAAQALFGFRGRPSVASRVLIVGALVLGGAAFNFAGGRGYTADEESAGGRIDAWAEGLNMLLTHPIFGVGYNRFTEFHTYTAHNSIVLGFAETGLVGYFVLLGLVVLTFKQLDVAATLAPPGSEGARMAVCLRASLVGYLACAMFLSRIYELNTYVLIAIAAASWRCAESDIPREKRPLLFKRIEWRYPTMLLLILTVTGIAAIVTLKNATIGRSI